MAFDSLVFISALVSSASVYSDNGEMPKFKSEIIENTAGISEALYDQETSRGGMTKAGKRGKK